MALVHDTKHRDTLWSVHIGLYRLHQLLTHTLRTEIKHDKFVLAVPQLDQWNSLKPKAT